MSTPDTESPPPNPPTLEVAVPQWEQVRRLCDRRSRGAVRVRARRSGLYVGERVDVILRLPSGFKARVPARVVKSRPAPRGGTPELTIELAGLSAHMVDRLRAMSAPHAEPSPTPQAVAERVRRVAAGTPRPMIDDWEQANWEQLMHQVCARMTVSELLDSNQRLRSQIDALRSRLVAKA